MAVRQGADAAHRGQYGWCCDAQARVGIAGHGKTCCSAWRFGFEGPGGWCCPGLKSAALAGTVAPWRIVLRTELRVGTRCRPAATDYRAILRVTRSATRWRNSRAS